MRNLLINIHCPSENTRRLRDAVVTGASHADLQDISLRIIEPLRGSAEDILWADAIIIGTTANFGYMSGALKDFFDRTYETCLDVSEGLPCAIAIRGRSDGTGALTSIEKVIAGLKWRQVQEPVITTGDFRQAFVDEWCELGQTVAAGLDAGIY